jgi:ABC-type multidrug transport system ATPase subunit
VKDLSGGQRRRLQLLLILFDEPNVLIMDEPTNDLDTDMLAVTEDLLDTWPGTLIVVSHDRYFIERVTDNQYAILDTHIEHVPGGVDEYLEKLAALQKAKAGRAQAQAAGAAPSAPAADAPTGLSNAERHELKKQVHSLERKMKSQRERIEKAQAALEAADPYDFEALGEAQAKVQAAQDALSDLEDAWLEASEKLEG